MNTLTFSYPISANRYWKSFRNRMVVSSEAKAYKAHVCAVARANGISDPTTAPVSLALILRPVQPKDWHKRQKTDPNGYTVRCLDIDNALKVGVDALQGIVYINDNQVVDLHVKRGMPVEGGALIVSWSVLA